MTASTIRTVPTLGQRLRRLVLRTRIALLRTQISLLEDEREHYSSLGWTGPVYLRNSYAMQLQLMVRARDLEGRL